MNADRPLDGIVVGISASESGEMEQLGFNRADLNRCVVRLSEALLAAGARLAFGHDWRPGGVMEAVAALAVRYFAFPTREQKREAPIINRVAAPDVPFLAKQDGEATSSEARSAGNTMAGLLAGIVDARQSVVPLGTTRENALSFMREELADLCQVRVCLGGKMQGFSGKLPGVIEEALLTLSRGQDRPLLVSGIFGGASSFIVNAITNEHMDLPPETALEEAKHKIRSRFAESRRPLDANEEDNLWRSTSIEQCVELVLRGAVKWSQRYRPLSN